MWGARGDRLFRLPAGPALRGWEEIKEDGIINVPLLFPELRHLKLKELPKLSNILCLFEEEKSVLPNQLVYMSNTVH